MTGEPTGRTDSGTRDGTPPAPRLRASDADRQVVVHRLQDAVARGQLTFEEGSDRMARAWASTHRDQLPALTADLPAPAPPPPAAPGWQALGELALLQLRTTLGGAAGPASREARVRLAALSVAALLLVGLFLGLVGGVLAAHAGDPGAFGGGFRR
jgi:hypothetical protein